MNTIQMVVSWGFFGPIFMFQHEIKKCVNVSGFLNHSCFGTLKMTSLENPSV